MRVWSVTSSVLVFAMLAGLQPAIAQNGAQTGAQNAAPVSAIAVPPPPPVASVPAQPLIPPRVITPAQPAPAPAAAPAYRLVQPRLSSPAGGPAEQPPGEQQWNSGGGGAVPILAPGPSPQNTPRPNTGNQPQPAIAAAPPPVQNFASAASSVAPPPNPWVPRQNAVLGVLNKEDGAISRLAVQVGNTVVQGKLKITILACVTRPKILPPDAAVFLSVKNSAQNQQDTNGQAAGSAKDARIFKGWLLRSEPGASVVGDATDVFRLIGCGAF